MRPRALRASAWAWCGVRASHAASGRNGGGEARGHGTAGWHAGEAVQAGAHAHDLRVTVPHRGNMHVSLRGDNGDSETAHERLEGTWARRTRTRASEEDDGGGAQVRPRPGKAKGGTLAWLWRRIKNAFGDG